MAGRVRAGQAGVVRIKEAAHVGSARRAPVHDGGCHLQTAVGWQTQREKQRSQLLGGNQIDIQLGIFRHDFHPGESAGEFKLQPSLPGAIINRPVRGWGH